MKIEIREPNKTGELTLDTFYANDRKEQQYKNFVKHYKSAKRTNNKLRFYVDGTLEVIL